LIKYDPAILWIGQYTLYDGIDEYDEINDYLRSITMKSMYSVTLTRTTVRNDTAFFLTGCEGFETSQKPTGLFKIFSSIINTGSWFEKISSTDFYTLMLSLFEHAISLLIKIYVM